MKLNKLKRNVHAYLFLSHEETLSNEDKTRDQNQNSLSQDNN